MERIRGAYDLTVEEHSRGIDPLQKVPLAFRESAGFKAFEKDSGESLTNSGAPENKEFLNPQPGMRFLDGGCSANLARYRLHEWPSAYYGVDISPALIGAMRNLATREDISIGGLEVAELADLPFDNGFFDIAAAIGVLEYVDLGYCRIALSELNRVLKASARLVIDIPNIEHPHVETMFKLEEYLGRPNIPKPRADFEAVLTPLFDIVRADDSRVMLKYFLEAKM